MSTEKLPEFRLDQLQQWMQAVIIHPGGIVAGVEAESALAIIAIAPEQVEGLITRSQSQSGIERLEIYSRAYFARLLECLRSQFPQFAKALGEELFARFAYGYLMQYPSQSYTLANLGDRFVPYLAETRPADASAAAWPDWLIDLARLEWQFDQVFEGAGNEGQPQLAAEQIRSLPADRWPEARFVPAPCLRLLTLRYPIHEYYRALRQGEPAHPPRAETTHLAISRREYIVRYFALDEPQHALLSAIVGGATLGEAIEQLAQQQSDLDVLANQLHAWFELWTAEGFFSRIEWAVEA